MLRKILDIDQINLVLANAKHMNKIKFCINVPQYHYHKHTRIERTYRVGFLVILKI